MCYGVFESVGLWHLLGQGTSVAPTMLHLMNVAQPADMTGNNLAQIND